MRLEELLDYLIDSSLITERTTVSIRLYESPFDTVTAEIGKFYQSQIQKYNRRIVERFELSFFMDYLEIVVDGLSIS